MTLAADSIRRLVQAHVGARRYLGLLFWYVLAQNINGMLTGAGYGTTRVRMWVLGSAILAGATWGSYHQWRFGRVEPQKPDPWRRSFGEFMYGILGATVFVVVAFASVVAVFALGRGVGTRPRDIGFLIVSMFLAISLARSHGERLGWVLPLLASAGLLATLIVPVLQPYRVVGYAGMTAALIIGGIQLHLVLTHGLRHAQI
jgi:hypothetical protein